MKKLLIIITFAYITFSCQPPKQEDQTFEVFIKNLEDRPNTERQALVDQYLSEIETPVIEGKENVHFIWYGEAEKLEIEGDLQKAWSTPETLNRIDCGDRDFFHISYTLPSDALLEYRFIADGKRVIDLNNPQVTQSFDYGNRNIFGMPDFVRSPTLNVRLDIQKGITNRWVFKTDNPLFSNRLIWIYTPYGYSKDKEYPVLYVNDGMWAMYTRPFINVVDNLIHDNKIEPIVVIFVAFEERWSEYVSQSTEYSRMMVDEMIPFVEENFQVSSSADKRGIVGASAGGHGAIITAFQNSDFFGNVASQGGGAGGYPGLNPLANEALDTYLIRKDKYPLKNVYTEVGTYDLEFPDQNATFIDGARQFHKRLKENNIAHTYKEVNSGHTGDQWNQSIEDILILFFGK